ncbi:MAG: hypothetical protein H6559_00280 [Lewinellaceae bacterium]|nr:hypothetical protein [Lewinellaceae bacterium]
MPLLFLSFANSPTAPLPTLSQEDQEVNRFLSIRAAKNHFAIHRESNISVGKVAEYIGRFRDSLSLFLFSGHAGRDSLFMGGQAAQAEGIAELLGQCPQLKLVVLNGCSTAGQVRRLLNLPNKPVVIATSAPVDDFAATQFSISFFQAMSEQYATVQEAFDMGLAAAKTEARNPELIRASRQLATGVEESEGVWLLQAPEGGEDLLQWKLPSLLIRTEAQEVEPNQFLLKGLLNSLTAFDAGAKALMEGTHSDRPSRIRRRIKSSDTDKRNVILKCLPLPISEQIERLTAPNRDDKQTFYDSFSFDRLKQLLHTYNIAMELPAFILLAQLYDLLANENVNVQISREQAQKVADFLSAPHETRLRLAYFPMMEAAIDVLNQNNTPLFMPELAEFTLGNSPPSGSLSRRDAGRLGGAGVALELKKQRLPNLKGLPLPEITRECIEAEEMLTEILSQLSFLATYALVSVRNIDVLRNRLFRTPSFVHRVVHLAKKDIGAPDEVVEELDDFLDNESVLLMKEQELSGKASFLNLTPFVIDENAYVKKASEIKLHYFHHFREANGAYCFKHTYKPEDRLLEIWNRETEDAEETALLDVWEQFDDFRNLVQAAAL